MKIMFAPSPTQAECEAIVGVSHGAAISVGEAISAATDSATDDGAGGRRLQEEPEPEPEAELCTFVPRHAPAPICSFVPAGSRSQVSSDHAVRKRRPSSKMSSFHLFVPSPRSLSSFPLLFLVAPVAYLLSSKATWHDDHSRGHSCAGSDRARACRSV